MAAQVLWHLVAFALFVIGAEGWRCAKYKHYFSQQPDYIDCLWDCCGNSFNRHCCAPIGIIVGCCIVGSVVVAALVVVMICWWQRRRARYSKGPRLFHNRRHSHYPVAPTSVTRPAPMMGYGGPDPGYKRPPQDYGPPPQAGYRPGPPPQGYRPGPPQGYRGPPGPPGPPRSEKPPPNYNGRRGSPPREEKVPLDDFPGEQAVDI